jgi:uncharacterized Rossmann fold enzyme
MINLEKYSNRNIYISPYNEPAKILYNKLLSKGITIFGFIDSNKLGENIYNKLEDNSIVILAESKFLHEIYLHLKSQNDSITFLKLKNNSNKLIFINYDSLLYKQSLTEINNARKELIKNTKSDDWLKSNKNLHYGKRCFIVATGPSLNLLDLSKLKNEFTIGVNGIYKIAHEIDLKYFIYVSDWYYKYHIEGLRSFDCKRRFIPIELKDDLNSTTPTSYININRPIYTSSNGFKNKVPHGFSKSPEQYFEAGGTVIFLALQLAYHLGFHEVILLGLDHSYSNDNSKFKKHSGDFYDTSNGDDAHFIKDYNPPNIKYHLDLEAMENAYNIAKNEFNKKGIKIYNASANSKLTIFEKVKYDKLFEI